LTELVTVTGGIIQSVPCTAAIFWVLINSDQSSLIAAETSISEAKIWREMSLNFAEELSLSYSAGIFNMP
jgi:hypothetical protein